MSAVHSINTRTQGVVQWQLPRETNLSQVGRGNARRLQQQQQGAASPNSIAFISSAFRNANQRSEDSIIGLQINSGISVY